MAKSSKLYKGSPSLKRDEESGKVQVKKSEDKPDGGIKDPTEADGEDMGIAGDNLTGDQAQMPVDVQQVGDTSKRHSTEIKDMHKRHQDEMSDMHKRHLKEVKNIFSKKED